MRHHLLALRVLLTPVSIGDELCGIPQAVDTPHEELMKKEIDMGLPRISTQEEWLAARKELLSEEQNLARARDALIVERRRLPMVEIIKDYAFDGPEGRAAGPLRGPPSAHRLPRHV
jgi:Bacterial protein of unknown function (DUF899)